MANTILAPDGKALAQEQDSQPTVHHLPTDFSDRFALGFTKLLRFIADTFFAKRYGHRAIVLETVAAVPGMVGAMITHLTSPAPHERRRRLDPNPDGRGRERAHAPDDLHRDRQADALRAARDLAGAVGLSGRLLRPVPGLLAHRAPRGRLFRGRGGDQLYLVSQGDRRRAGRPMFPLRQSPSITGRWPTMRRCAMSSWWCAPTKRITATSTTALRTSLAAPPPTNVAQRRTRSTPAKSG